MVAGSLVRYDCDNILFDEILFSDSELVYHDPGVGLTLLTIMNYTHFNKTVLLSARILVISDNLFSNHASVFTSPEGLRAATLVVHVVMF